MAGFELSKVSPIIDPKPRLQRRIPQIELIRVMATTAIFVFHLWSLVPIVSTHSPIDPLLARIPLLGAVGVILFNFIAGFVLAAPLVTAEGILPGPGYGTFLDRRFSRICRHYYPVLLLWTGLYLALPPRSAGEVGKTLGDLLSHLLMVHTLSADTFFTIVPAFWWMGLLAQFYLVFPLLWAFLRRIGLNSGCALVCVGSWTAWGILANLADSRPGSPIALVAYLGYFNLPFRLPEFAIGIWLAATLYRCESAGYRVGSGCFILPPFSSWPLAMALFGSLFALSSDVILQHLARPLDHAYLVLWTLALFYTVFSWAPSETLGGSPFLLRLASASFSTYLLHQPLLGYAEQLLPRTLDPGLKFFVLLILVGPLCYLAAVSLDRLIRRFAPGK